MNNTVFQLSLWNKKRFKWNCYVFVLFYFELHSLHNGAYYRSLRMNNFFYIIISYVLCFLLFLLFFLYRNIFSAYSDNGEGFSSKGSALNSFLDHNLNCIGNETVIHDCPTNDNSCSSFLNFAAVTELRCKGKKQWFYIKFCIITWTTYPLLLKS